MNRQNRFNFRAILFGMKGVTMNNLAPMRICPGCKVVSFQDNNIAAIKLNTGRYSQTSKIVKNILYATLKVIYEGLYSVRS